MTSRKNAPLQNASQSPRKSRSLSRAAVAALGSILLLCPALGGAAEEAGETAPAASDQRLLLDSLKLKLSGVLFAFWSYDLDSADPAGQSPNGANRFEVSRAYINVEPQITRSISLRITPDITRVSGTDSGFDGSLALRLKYAYAEFKDVSPGVAIKGGLQQTSYIDFSDSVWKYRVLGPEALEFFTGMPSSDLGIGATGKHLGGLLETQLQLLNGEGYQKPENPDRDGTKYKDLNGRITLAPFAGSGSALVEKLRLTLYAQYGVRSRVDDRDADRIRTMALATWEHELGTVGVGAGPTWDGVPNEAGTSVHRRRGLLFTSWGFVNLPLHLRLVGRYDRFDPDVEGGAAAREADDTAGIRTRLIAGLAYRFDDQVQLIGDYQRYGYEFPEATTTKDARNALFLHLEAKY